MQEVLFIESMQAQSNVIASHSAPVQEVFRLARDADPEDRRTLGVLTKVGSCPHSCCAV